MPQTNVSLRAAVIGVAALLAAAHTGPARKSPLLPSTFSASPLSLIDRGSRPEGDGLLLGSAPTDDLDDDERWRVFKPLAVALSGTIFEHAPEIGTTLAQISAPRSTYRTIDVRLRC